MTYVVVTIILLVLTAANIGAAIIGLNFVVNLLIALVEGVIMVLWFMRLRWSSPVSKLVAVAALAWLAILLSGTLEDVLTRAWLS